MRDSELRIALVGNKNSGKSALFNALTGQKVHVGNYPGVTTHLQWGALKADHANLFEKTSVRVIDMPGLSSLNAYSTEEKDALASLTHQRGAQDTPNLLIDVIDAGNIEMGLYLALQLLELNMPTVIALNMIDEATSNGVTIDTAELGRELGVPVVPISATKQQGITALLEKVASLANDPAPERRIDFCSGDLHKAIHSVCHILEVPAHTVGMPVRYAAEKVIEHDEAILAQLDVEQEDLHVIDHIIDHLEKDSGLASETVMAKERYSYVDDLCARCINRADTSREQQRSQKIDKVLTHRIWGIPIYLCVMALVFWLTFSVIGGPLQEALESLFNWSGGAFGDFLLGVGVNHWVYDLVINGVWAGVFSVLSFLPIIMVLFFFLSFLEDSGYMTRVAFVMDKLLRKIGLSGRSFAPLIVGFGCNVPAIMATRTLPSERDRKLTILLTPFMSCSAKLPVYGMITAAFFGTKATLVMISLYVLGIVVAILLGFVLSRTLFKGDAMMYVMELPAYRWPALSDVVRHMWNNAKEFVKKAFTIIFLGTVVIWVLQNIDVTFNPVSDSSQSILAAIGTQISFIFKPIGLDSWEATTALLAGLAAKEAIVSTLTVLMGPLISSGLTIAAALATIFTPLTAFTFLVFILLYVPCLATFAATRKELDSTIQAIGIVVMQLVLAYVVCFVIYHVGLIIVG
ncbi:MAG: ferrous iron transport protein B [Eggerthellaceae bacterium]|nr:ferrous iron transport protein B [Eggerthellaceae bacterium]